MTMTVEMLEAGLAALERMGFDKESAATKEFRARLEAMREEQARLAEEAVFKPYSVTLQLRKTHTFVGTWQHEDQWETLGTATVLQKLEQCTDPEDMCEPTTIKLMVEVKLDAGVVRANLRQALRDTFTSVGCSHEWDCCGCWSHHVRTVDHVADNTFVVTQHASRNY